MANHVLMISNDAALALQPSGDARARHLGYAERIGHLSIIVPTPPGVDTPIAASPNLTIYASNSPLKARYPIDAIRRAIAIDRAQRVELIVTHDPFLTGAIGAVLRARLGAPLLVQNHSAFFDNPYWLRERLHHRLYAPLGRLVLRAADMYRTVNAHQRRAFIAAGGDKRRTVMLPLGTITEAFAAPVPSERVEALRQQLAIPATAPLIAWVGYGTPFKRLPLLLQVFARLRDRLPDARLLLVGDLRRSPDDLERLMRRMGIRDVVHTPGVIPHHELPAYYALADAYALTSAYEGAPRVLFEAGAVGVPLVAMRVPGVEEVIVDGVNGYIAPDRDIDGMMGRLLTILRDPILAAQMSAAARRLALERYDAERYADRWIGVWQTTIRIGRKSADRRAQALT